MSKNILKVEYNYDFELIGIADNVPDYKLCWILNSALGWRLEKKEDIKVPQTKSKYKITDTPQLFENEEVNESSHPLYVFEDEPNDVNYIVIGNKSNGLLFLPETPRINHFLMIKGWLEDDKLTQIVEKINQIPFISTAFKLNFREFANKQNLIFEYDKPKQNENSSYIRTGLLKPRSVRTND